MSMKSLNTRITRCKLCRLWKNRKNAVPGQGGTKKKIMFIGEAPGRIEDLEGKPFMGRAGRFLNVQLSGIGLKRDKVFLTSIVKCRPPGNRRPKKDEIEACFPYLKRQMRMIRPKIVVPMGDVAIKALLGKKHSVTKHHGRVVRRKGIAYIPMPHPAAAMRFPKWKRGIKQDFVVLKDIISRI